MKTINKEKEREGRLMYNGSRRLAKKEGEGEWGEVGVVGRHTIQVLLQWVHTHPQHKQLIDQQSAQPTTTP